MSYNPIVMKILSAAAVILFIIAFLEGGYIYLTHDLTKRIFLPSYSYTDSLYPHSSSSSQPEDISVGVKGSWLSDTELADPIQTVDIFCFKPSMQCTMTDAAIQESNSFFFSTNTSILEIDRWTEREIVTVPNRFACVEYVYKIDRKSETTSSIRRTTNNTSGLCNGIQKDPIVMTLGDGYKRTGK